MKTWRRPTLPRLKTQYHWRKGSLLPSSEWDRVWPPRYNHQVIKTRRPKFMRKAQARSGGYFYPDYIGCSGNRITRNALSLPLHMTAAIKPIERLVPVSFIRYRTSTPGLSTWWSSTALKGELVLREASRLDAFSGYPVRT